MSIHVRSARKSDRKFNADALVPARSHQAHQTVGVAEQCRRNSKCVAPCFAPIATKLLHSRILSLRAIAARDGRTVAANMLGGNRTKPNYRGIPSVAFTIPPIASVGLTEKQARDQGMKFRTQKENTHDWYTSRSVGESTYGYKVLIESDTSRILGAHLVGPHADEVINLFAIAIRRNLTTQDLEDAVFAYPTAGSDVHHMF
jgi:pyruvate/2-oxoglutarate dehydrogenase complex dihydrolipoamide dehydrogenase (E3) component